MITQSQLKAMIDLLLLIPSMQENCMASLRGLTDAA